MKGFKDSSKTVWVSGGYAKGGSVNGAAKVSKVMREFKSGELHSGSKTGPKVTNRKQATAIAMSEAGKTRKAEGGVVKPRPGEAPNYGDLRKGYWDDSTLEGGPPATDKAIRARATLSDEAFPNSRRAQDTAMRARNVENSNRLTQETKREIALRRLEDAARTPGASTYAKDRYRMAKETGMVQKAEGGPVGKLAAKRSMHREQEARTDAIVARGNRVAAEEQPSEALVMRRRGPNTPLIQSSAPPRSLLERKACGGLAAMPRKQGR